MYMECYRSLLLTSNLGGRFYYQIITRTEKHATSSAKEPQMRQASSTPTGVHRSSSTDMRGRGTVWRILYNTLANAVNFLTYTPLVYLVYLQTLRKESIAPILLWLVSSSQHESIVAQWILLNHLAWLLSILFVHMSYDFLWTFMFSELVLMYM